MSINGKEYSWEDITITLPHGVMIGIQDIEYSDKKATNAEYGRGSNPVGYSVGNYSATCKVSLLRTEYEKLADAFKNEYSSFYRHKPFPITASYANDDQPTVTDTLQSVRITEQKLSEKQGDKASKVELTGIVLNPILWNGYPAND